MYTENEVLVLKAAINFFNYGDESEKDDNAVVFDLNDLKSVTGMPLASLKGVVGSLFKKGLFVDMWCSEMGENKEIGVSDEGIDAVLEVQ